MNQKAPEACNFNCHFENEGLLKIVGSHVHCKCGSMSEMMQDVFVTIDQ